MRKILTLIVSVLLVITLTSCGVEEVRYSTVRYMGYYNDEIYFTLSDSKTDYVDHLYKFSNEKFEYVEEFEGIHFSLLEEGKLIGESYVYEDVELHVYDLSTGDLNTYTLDSDLIHGRIMGYHEGIVMLYTTGVQREGDEFLTLYSTITNEVIESYFDTSIGVGYGEGDFDVDYIYLSSEGGHDGSHKNVRINRSTGEIVVTTWPYNYASYGYDSNLIYYSKRIGDNTAKLISKDDVPNSFFGKYYDISTELFYDDESSTYLFAYRQGGYIDILVDEDYVRYDVAFNEYYSYGFINDSMYYIIDKKEYGSVFKRIVINIEIHDIKTNEVLYSSGNKTLSTQVKWDQRD